MTGFDFSNHSRNVALHARGVPLPKATSTGTTIVGCIYNGGVVVRFAVSLSLMKGAFDTLSYETDVPFTDCGRYESNQWTHSS